MPSVVGPVTRGRWPNRLQRAGVAEKGGAAMSVFTLRKLALASGIVAGLLGAWAASAEAQQSTTAPLFSSDLTVGWIGMGEFRPVPGRVPPITNDPKYPYVPNGTGKQPTYRIADLTNPNLK